MTMRSGRALAMAALCATQAWALDSPQWPPPGPVEARMRELQLVIIDRDSTASQREAAREELAGLLKSPAGQARRRTPDEKPSRPARSAIDPYPSVVRPAVVAPAPAPPAAGVARVEIVVPPKPLVNPQTGSVAAPTGRFAIDPRTGQVLHEAGNGFVDPRTGQFTPR
jgi:hypothetical protein